MRGMSGGCVEGDDGGYGAVGGSRIDRGSCGGASTQCACDGVGVGCVRLKGAWFAAGGQVGGGGGCEERKRVL